MLLDLWEKKALDGTIAANLIEFGRSVHAEMAAISDAARRGTSLKGTYLYTTTFPCHLCARDIVAAGIHQVFYVAPYPKSLAGRLFKDSIAIDSRRLVHGKVAFRPFVGISPGIYTDIFRMAFNRKQDSGKVKVWKANDAKIRLRRLIPSYVMIEQQVVGDYITRLLAGVGLHLAK